MHDKIGVDQVINLNATIREKTNIVTNGTSIVLPGKQNSGMLVNQTTPRYGWADLKGSYKIDTSGLNPPTTEVFISGIERDGYKVNGKLLVEFHVDHNCVIGGDKYLHLHISKSGDSVASGANFQATATILHSLGHGHKDPVTDIVPSSPATITKTFVFTVAQFNNIGYGSEDITQLLFANNAGISGNLNSLLILPDDKIYVNIIVTDIPTFTGGSSTSVFLSDCDIHLEVTDGSGTAYMDTSNGSFYVP